MKGDWFTEAFGVNHRTILRGWLTIRARRVQRHHATPRKGTHMGDRSNVVLRMEQQVSGPQVPLWLYSHWGGEDFTTRKLAYALAEAKSRWDDETYFNRIVIQHLFDDLIGSETGGGVGLYPSDNEHEVVVVDRSIQRVEVYPDEGLTNRIASYSFEEYITKYEGN